MITLLKSPAAQLLRPPSCRVASSSARHASRPLQLRNDSHNTHGAPRVGGSGTSPSPLLQNETRPCCLGGRHLPSASYSSRLRVPSATQLTSGRSSANAWGIHLRRVPRATRSCGCCRENRDPKQHIPTPRGLRDGPPRATRAVFPRAVGEAASVDRYPRGTGASRGCCVAPLRGGGEGKEG